MSDEKIEFLSFVDKTSTNDDFFYNITEYIFMFNFISVLLIFLYSTLDNLLFLCIGFLNIISIFLYFYSKCYKVTILSLISSFTSFFISLNVPALLILYTHNKIGYILVFLVFVIFLSVFNILKSIRFFDFSYKKIILFYGPFKIKVISDKNLFEMFRVFSNQVSKVKDLYVIIFLYFIYLFLVIGIGDLGYYDLVDDFKKDKSSSLASGLILSFVSFFICGFVVNFYVFFINFLKFKNVGK